MSVSYSGDQGATLSFNSFYVINTSGDFLGTLPSDGTTTQYFNAGGVRYAAGASLNPFKSNILFKDFASERRVLDNKLSSFKSQFDLSAGKARGATTGVTGSVVYTSVRDPRASHLVSLNTTSNGLGANSTGFSHMDEIIFTARVNGTNAGNTLQGFFGGFFDGSTTGSTNSILILYPGTSGSGGITSFSGLTASGSSMMAEHVKTGNTSGVLSTREILGSRDISQKLFGQAALFLKQSNNRGETVGVDYGTAGKTATYLRYPLDLSKTFMDGLLALERLYSLNTLCLTGDSSKQRPGEIFLPYFGDSTSFSGITVDGVSGGANGSSELQHLIASIEAKYRSDQATDFDVFTKFSGDFTIRELVNIKF